MRFSAPLICGRLVKRYKRFLADVVLDTGETVTATCPNTGSLLGLAAAGARVWLSRSDSATRKYPYTWELVEANLGNGPALVGVNTGHPNRLIAEAITAGEIKGLDGYDTLRREVKYGKNSRIDILLESRGRAPCYVEVKNVHMMRRAGAAEFPDSVTARGAKHLAELGDMVRAGHRAMMVFLIQRGDAARLEFARDIDPTYGAAFDAAMTTGVEALALRCTMSPDSIAIALEVPIAK